MRASWLLPILITISLFAACDSDRKDRNEKDKQEKGRHYEEGGRFSFVPPDGWQVVQLPGMKYGVFSGPTANGFAPNINVLDEAYAGSLDDYVTLSIRNLRVMFPQFLKLSQEDLKLDSGLPAVRVVGRNSMNNMEMEQTMYFVKRSSKMFVITGSKLASDGRNLANEFEKCARSFREER